MAFPSACGREQPRHLVGKAGLVDGAEAEGPKFVERVLG